MAQPGQNSGRLAAVPALFIISLLIFPSQRRHCTKIKIKVSKYWRKDKCGNNRRSWLNNIS